MRKLWKAWWNGESKVEWEDYEKRGERAEVKKIATLLSAINLLG